ncbi:MAG: histidine triad nucleotide-binding protein [Fidelibacterota bacterium]
MADCLFCQISSGAIPSDRVYENDQLFAFRDIDPQAPTHILIVPKEHVETINDLEQRHEQLAGAMIMLAKDLASREGVAESGYRMVFNCNADGGQAVYHIHLHLLGGRKMNWPPG